ncbi:DNA methyltransferase [Paenibacillus farraposensis]|uniref:DNA methyltransferase n=1 Tax=Paenibacillus farraposensis TaxID=2807095 RepID=UPI0036070B23
MGNQKDFGDKEFKHACPFPPDMMARIIKLSSDEGDVVFDPYAGTGVLLATAQNLNRRFLGLDTNPDYKQIFEQVTKPLIEEKIQEINNYYEKQEKMKLLLSKTIYKLRILKFSKAMIKIFNKIFIQNSKNNSPPIIATIVIEEKMNCEEKNTKHKIGKANYYFVLRNSLQHVNGILLILKELSENAPFSKYGLITKINLITVEEAIDLLATQENNFNFNMYSNGIVNDSYGVVSFEKMINLIQNVEDELKTDEKNITPIFSNVEIKTSDYEEIPAKKYKKRTINKIIS